MNHPGRSVWLLVCALALLSAGCTLPGEPKLADRPLRPDEVKDFGVLFRENCSGCHGANGEWGPAPPLNDKRFRAIIPDAELVRVVSEGRNGTLMPAFARSSDGPLTDAQIE